MSDSIITIDIGGQIFRTTLSTLTKYPGSLLGTMFSHLDSGLAPMAKTKEGNYFLDANPIYFGEILEYLRHGKIIAKDSVLLEGVKELAKYFGLTELLQELESDHDCSWVVLDLERKKQIDISRRTLTRYKTTTLAKYFLGEKEAVFELSEWIKKEGENRYFIGRPLESVEKLLDFLREERRVFEIKEIKETFLYELNLFGFRGTCLESACYDQYYCKDKCNNRSFNELLASKSSSAFIYGDEFDQFMLKNPDLVSEESGETKMLIDFEVPCLRN
jgi:hypothetical protein